MPTPRTSGPLPSVAGATYEGDSPLDVEVENQIREAEVEKRTREAMAAWKKANLVAMPSVISKHRASKPDPDTVKSDRRRRNKAARAARKRSR